MWEQEKYGMGPTDEFLSQVKDQDISHEIMVSFHGKIVKNKQTNNLSVLVSNISHWLPVLRWHYSTAC